MLMIKALQAFDQGFLRDRIVGFRRFQRIQFQPVIGLQLRFRFRPALKVLTRLGVVAKTNQQIDQLQAQVIVVRVRRQQQLGVIGRDRIRLTAIGLEHFFALERQPQQAAHGDRHHRQCPRIEQAAAFVTEELDAEELTMTHLLHW